MTTPLPPGLPNDPLTSFFWEGARQRELHIQRCQSCGTYIHLPRPVCRNCQSFDLQGEKVSGLATLYSYTETFKPFHPFFVDRSPYILATIALNEQPGLHLLSNLVDVQNAEIKIGMPLQVTFEELDTNYVIPVFTAVGS